MTGTLCHWTPRVRRAQPQTESREEAKSQKGRNEKLGRHVGRTEGLIVWESRKRCKVEVGLFRGESKTTSESAMLERVEGHTGPWKLRMRDSVWLGRSEEGGG